MAKLTLAVVAAFAGVTAPLFTVRPEHPEQGTIAIIQLAPGEHAPVGAAAGEPLHFEADSAGYWALMAVPLSARDSLAVSVNTDTVYVPVTPRRRTEERLRVAPRFDEPLDSALLARVTAERAVARAAREQSHATPRLWQERFRRPVSGRTTSGFGCCREWKGTETTEQTPGATHDGVDLAGAQGTPVHSANRGIVAAVGDWYYGGTTVLLDHGGGLVTGYQHLSKVLVQVGDTVARGQIIGRVGATGRVTGPHLHWGASYGSVFVDPLSLLEVKAPR
jgi:murein DD-endopeptidase MepM/ murein hydrolase activator NlpD